MTVPSSIRLNARQIEVLDWIRSGCPDDVYPEGDYRHRSTARALSSRGLVEVRGHGKSWVARLTPRGELWPQATDEDEAAKRRWREEIHLDSPLQTRSRRRSAPIDEEETPPPPDASVRARKAIAAHPKRRVQAPKRIEKRETYMRYKVMVTRVQVAERWVRAVDEEEAARKVQEEFAKPFGYYGNWTTTTSEVEVVEAEQTTVIQPNPLAAEGPMLLSLKDAAKALGISYATIYDMTVQGDIEWTAIGRRKYISRQSIFNFIRENTHKGYRRR